MTNPGAQTMLELPKIAPRKCFCCNGDLHLNGASYSCDRQSTEHFHIDDLNTRAASAPAAVREALAIAKKALEEISDAHGKYYNGKFPRDVAWIALDHVEKALRTTAALQPVAWRYRIKGEKRWHYDDKLKDGNNPRVVDLTVFEVEPLYASPPPTPAVQPFGDREPERIIDADDIPPTPAGDTGEGEIDPQELRDHADRIENEDIPAVRAGALLREAANTMQGFFNTRAQRRAELERLYKIERSTTIPADTQAMREATIEECAEIARIIGPFESPIGIPAISLHDLRMLIVNGILALTRPECATDSTIPPADSRGAAE